MEDLDEVKAKARFYFLEKLERYKKSGDRSDFGRVIDSIVDMGVNFAADWCSSNCDADTTSCSVGLDKIINNN